MKPLSVVIITFNEEKNIARCLESVKGLADEIVVVDSLSQDHTQGICRQYGARVIEQPFLGYIEQKNFALGQATYDHVLSLDADEALDETLYRAVSDAKQAGFPYDGYMMSRCANYCGKWIRHGKWYPDRKLRLLNRRKGKWGGTNPHDKIEMDAGAGIFRLQGDILHYTYYTIDEHIQQMNRFTTIQSEAMLKKGKRSTIFHVIFNPVSAFITGYIFKKGFLDGIDGFLIAKSVAYQTLLKYVKLLQLQRKHNITN